MAAAGTGQQPTTASTTGAPADGEAGRIASIEQIQQEQREQRGLLEQLLTRLPGADNNAGQGAQGGKSTGAAAPATPGLNIGQIQEEVRRQIQETDQRREQDKAERDWREQVTATVEQVRQERQPREPQTGVRAVLRRALIGREP